MPRSLRRRLGQILDDAGPDPDQVVLKGLDVNDIRLALKNRSGSKPVGADRVFVDLRLELEDIARNQSKNFARALDEFAARATRGENVSAGRAALKGRTSEVLDVAKRVDDPNVGAGLRVGARSELADTAQESVTRAAKLSQDLTEDAGLVTRLRALLPAKEVDRLQQIGQLQEKAIPNIKNLSPPIPQAQGVKKLVGDAADAIVVTSPGTSLASKIFAFARGLKNQAIGLPDDVIENLARDAFDPKKTQIVIEALRRRNITDAQVLNLFSTAALAGGTEAANIGQ